ncbi:MAG TPA: caspase family protein [Thermoanaerobaculia bacterium]|nr:caspase family protein [Thermoanaerobaculia bacterium]
MRHFSLGLVVFFALSASARVVPKAGKLHVAQDGPVVPSESAAVFVGVSRFTTDDTLAEVPYAVDDAVDLAYVLALVGNPLVDAKRVVLALSGEPQKPESKEHLAALRKAGASVQCAGQQNIVKQLRTQSAAVGANGVLIISFATHGVSDNGVQYLFGEDSMLSDREMSISEMKVREIVTSANVARAVILLDACRQRLMRNQRAGDADPRSRAAMMEALSGMNGQVVLSAAAQGDYAYDDESRRNGVFTAAVIDGLQCEASRDDRGFITVDTLYAFVEERVLTWVQKHRDPNARRATQMYCEGKTKQMPLAACNTAVTGKTSSAALQRK